MWSCTRCHRSVGLLLVVMCLCAQNVSMGREVWSPNRIPPPPPPTEDDIVTTTSPTPTERNPIALSVEPSPAIGDDNNSSGNLFKNKQPDGPGSEFEDPNPEYPPPTVTNLKNVCILGTSDMYTAWWAHGNGTLNMPDEPDADLYFLDLSYKRRSPDDIAAIVWAGFAPNVTGTSELIAMSVAHANLTAVPREALRIVNASLELLTMRGNNFSCNPLDPLSRWSDFPFLPQLRELDLSECSIGALESTSFVQMPGLQRLYLAFNRIETLSPFAFERIPALFHLDMSYNFGIRPRSPNNTVEMLRNPTADMYLNGMDEGLVMPIDILRKMHGLLFLDLSYTRIRASTVRAFSQLPPNLELLSVCYTALPSLPPHMFAGTKLRVLDMSGNPSLATSLQFDSLHELSDHLHILAVDDSNIKSLSFFCTLKYLRILLLSGNNINVLYSDAFSGLESLEMVDLSANHLGNWYMPIFGHTPRLQLLKLHDNNINLITNAMFRDFQQLKYLALGKNPFLCTCGLRDFMDLAAANSRYAEDCTLLGSKRVRTNVSEAIRDHIVGNFRPHHLKNSRVLQSAVERPYDVGVRIHLDDMWAIKQSVEQMAIVKSMMLQYNVIMMGATADNGTQLPGQHLFSEHGLPRLPGFQMKRIDNEIMNFTFQLLDFVEDRYMCVNSTTSLMYKLTEIESCFRGDAEVSDDEVLTIGDSVEVIIGSVLGSVFLVIIAYCVIYYYWWYIRFVWMTLRNSALMGAINREHKLRLIKRKDGESVGITVDGDGAGKSEPMPGYTYDVFVSYCEQNRDWILEEFLTNMDQCSDIKVCLHERDFQIGLSILENIIHCMDQSRCLLLVISESFLLSQWCQFEMHLAQHRLLETRRDQLILILLEDIPRRKRPQTLHYLMRTKTYIKWPSKVENGKNSSMMASSLKMEQQQFWRRLKRALTNTEWEMNKSQTAKSSGQSKGSAGVV